MNTAAEGRSTKAIKAMYFPYCYMLLKYKWPNIKNISVQSVQEFVELGRFYL